MTHKTESGLFVPQVRRLNRVKPGKLRREAWRLLRR